MGTRLLSIAIVTTFLSFLGCNKEEPLDNEETFVFTAHINNSIWGTNSLFSKISQDQFLVKNQNFIIDSVCFDKIVGRYNDPEIGWVFLKDFIFSFIHIDELSKIYSATFEGYYFLSDSSITVKGEIDQANYFSEYCESTYKIIETDTISLYGKWYLIGYNSSGFETILYPPCNKTPWIQFDPDEDDTKSFRGVFIRNSFSGKYSISGDSAISLSLTGLTKVYICWDYDRIYEEEFIDLFRSNNTTDFSIEKNILTLVFNPAGRKYFFYKLLQ